MPRRPLRNAENVVPSLVLSTTIDCVALGEIVAEQATHEQALSVIKTIDRGMGDYDFTLAVARWCVAELRAETNGTDEPFTLEELNHG